MLQGGRTSTAMMTGEKSKADATKIQQCAMAVSMATKRLQLRGCGTQISLAEDGSNSIAGAPTDGSCSVYHVNGGGIKPCLPPSPTCDLTTLAIGEGCDGVIYAGLDWDNNRVYTNGADAGVFKFNNLTTSPVHPAGVATSMSNGLLNTNQLLAQSNTETPYLAAQACRALGPKWYLPSLSQWFALFDARNQGAIAGTIKVWPETYWTSQMVSTFGNTGIMMVGVDFNNFTFPVQGALRKHQSSNVRCVRGD